MTVHNIITLVTLASTVSAFVIVVIVNRRMNRNLEGVIAWAQRHAPAAHYMTRLGSASKCGIPRRNVAEAYDIIGRVTCGACRAALGVEPLPETEPVL